MLSSHHYDAPWCMVGEIVIMYHTTISTSISVQYDERTVFGSHGAYAVWTGTSPRSYSVSANLVAANSAEVVFNLLSVKLAYMWTQNSPPGCKILLLPTSLGASLIFGTMVRIESMDANIDEGVHLDPISGGSPIQITFSMSLKECKPI
jgi:hypothetical protein